MPRKKVEKVEEKKEEVEEYITRPVLLKDFDVLIGEIVTEESQKLTQTQNALVFAVNKKASKPEIKSAIEALFHAKVRSVNTMNKTGKTKRVGRFTGKLPDYKKAIVRFDSSFDLGKISQAVASEDRLANPTEEKK